MGNQPSSSTSLVAGVSSLSASAIVAEAVSGSHILRIDGYSRTKGIGNGKFIKSETFLVWGHPMHLKYYPDGYLIGDPGSIFIFLNLADSIAAAGDQVLKAEFKISLLDKHGNPVRSYSKRSPPCAFSSGRACMGYELIGRADLERSVYLRDDVFSVRCDVTVAKEIVTKPSRLISSVFELS